MKLAAFALALVVVVMLVGCSTGAKGKAPGACTDCFDYGPAVYAATVTEHLTDNSGIDEKDSWEQPIEIVQDGSSLMLAGILFKADENGMSADYTRRFNAFIVGRMIVDYEGASGDDPMKVSLRMDGEMPDFEGYSYTYEYEIELFEDVTPLAPTVPRPLRAIPPWVEDLQP